MYSVHQTYPKSINSMKTLPVDVKTTEFQNTKLNFSAPQRVLKDLSGSKVPPVIPAKPG